MSNRDEKDLLPGIVAGLLLVPISFAVTGWVLSVLWGWFVVPLGLKQIGLAHAIGLSTVVGLMTGVLEQQNSAELEKRPFWSRLLVSTFIRLLVLGMGWVIHKIMVG